MRVDRDEKDASPAGKAADAYDNDNYDIENPPVRNDEVELGVQPAAGGLAVDPAHLHQEAAAQATEVPEPGYQPAVGGLAVDPANIERNFLEILHQEAAQGPDPSAKAVQDDAAVQADVAALPDDVSEGKPSLFTPKTICYIIIGLAVLALLMAACCHFCSGEQKRDRTEIQSRGGTNARIARLESSQDPTKNRSPGSQPGRPDRGTPGPHAKRIADAKAARRKTLKEVEVLVKDLDAKLKITQLLEDDKKYIQTGLDDIIKHKEGIPERSKSRIELLLKQFERAVDTAKQEAEDNAFLDRHRQELAEERSRHPDWTLLVRK